MSLYYDGNMVSGVNFTPQLTLAEYNALSVKPTYWIRTDAPEDYGRLPASEVGYDNTTSGLTADDVQDAVDELHSKKLDKCVVLNNITDAATLNTFAAGTVYMAYVTADSGTQGLPFRNMWCTFYTFGNGGNVKQDCVSANGVSTRRWDIVNGWTSWTTTYSTNTSFINKFNTSILAGSDNVTTVDIKINNGWGGYQSYGGILFTRYAIHAVLFSTDSTGQNFSNLLYKTLVGSETLTLTGDATNHLVTVKGGAWNGFGLLAFGSYIGATVNGTITLRNARLT
jgi:hypothetical protein